PFFAVAGERFGEDIVAVKIDRQKDERDEAVKGDMPQLFPAPAQSAVTEHQRSAETRQADAGITGHTPQTGDHGHTQQPRQPMALEIPVTGEEKEQREQNKQRLRPDIAIDLEQTWAAQDKKQEDEGIAARDPG